MTYNVFGGTLNLAQSINQSGFDSRRPNTTARQETRVTRPLA